MHRTNENTIHINYTLLRRNKFVSLNKYIIIFKFENVKYRNFKLKIEIESSETFVY